MKKHATVELTCRDLRALALMLRLHAYEAEEAAAEAAAIRRGGKPHRSWARSGRKARSFAAQFEDVACELEYGRQQPRRII
jgi:hypothetical protein